MKHLKSYNKIFENQEVVNAGIVNALEKQNYQLFIDLATQHSNLIHWDYVIKHFLENKEKLFHYFSYVPSKALEGIESLIINNFKLTTLKGIENFTNLTFFKLS